MVSSETTLYPALQLSFEITYMYLNQLDTVLNQKTLNLHIYELKKFKPSETGKTKRAFNPLIAFVITRVK